MALFFRKHTALVIVVGLLVLAGGWYLFPPEKLFINKKVNEAAPLSSSNAAQPVYTGLLATTLQESSGRATVYRALNGAMSLRLSDFMNPMGPMSMLCSRTGTISHCGAILPNRLCSRSRWRPKGQ